MYDNLASHGRILIQTVNFDQDGVKEKVFPLLTDEANKIQFSRKYLPHKSDNTKVRFITELNFSTTDEKYSDESELLILTESELRRLILEAGFISCTTYCNFTDKKWDKECNSTVILAEC